jgi:hypothetical protein
MRGAAGAEDAQGGLTEKTSICPWVVSRVGVVIPEGHLDGAGTVGQARPPTSAPGLTGVDSKPYAYIYV